MLIPDHDAVVRIVEQVNVPGTRPPYVKLVLEITEGKYKGRQVPCILPPKLQPNWLPTQPTDRYIARIMTSHDQTNHARLSRALP